VTAQGGIIIALLTALVVLEGWGLWPDISGTAATAAPQPPAFSVTSTGEGQYVMRANDNIFFCVGNRCTTIQLITAQQKPQQPAGPAGDGSPN
jgi:hypothetical protein